MSLQVVDGQVVRPPAISRFWSWALVVRWPITLVTVALILVVWEIAARTFAPAYVVGPVQIVQEMVSEIGRLSVLSVYTLSRILAGFLIGASLGVLLGLINGAVDSFREFTEPVVSLTYPVPKIALFPALAVIMGYTDVSRVFIIALAAFYPAYLAAAAGSRFVEPTLIQLARNAGLGRARIFLSVITPAAMPRVFTGLRISLAVSFVLAYVAEALGGTGQGLGFRIVFVAQTDNYAPLYAAIACFALLGVLGDRLLLWIGRWVTRGQELEVIGDAR